MRLKKLRPHPLSDNKLLQPCLSILVHWNHYILLYAENILKQFIMVVK